MDGEDGENYGGHLDEGEGKGGKDGVLLDAGEHHLTSIVLRAQGAVGSQPTATISEVAGHVLGIVVVETVPNVGRNVKDI